MMLPSHDCFGLVNQGPEHAESYLAHLLELPLLKSEMIAMRKRAVELATAKLPEEDRLRVISKVDRIREMDQERDVVRAAGRPGILADFADTHPWMWWKVDEGKRVRF